MKNYRDLLTNANEWAEKDGHYIYTRDVGEEQIEYEILHGNEKIVFIKAGAGGSARGYEDKYLKMARRIHERIGATVICASNPDEPHEELDEAEIKRVISEKSFSNVKLYFVGASDGAYHNLSLARKFPETKKWLGINTSYIVLSELEEKLNGLSSVTKTMIYGTKDDDFDEVIPTLRKLENDKLKIVLFEGADHSFTGMVDEFVALSDYLDN